MFVPLDTLQLGQESPSEVDSPVLLVIYLRRQRTGNPSVKSPYKLYERIPKFRPNSESKGVIEEDEKRRNEDEEP